MKSRTGQINMIGGPRAIDSMLSAPEDTVVASNLQSYHNPLASLQVENQEGDSTMQRPQRQSYPPFPVAQSSLLDHQGPGVPPDQVYSASNGHLAAQQQYQQELPPDVPINQQTPHGGGRFRNNHNNSSID